MFCNVFSDTLTTVNQRHVRNYRRARRIYVLHSCPGGQIYNTQEFTSGIKQKNGLTYPLPRMFEIVWNWANYVGPIKVMEYLLFMFLLTRFLVCLSGWNFVTDFKLTSG